eukprot:CAMPEP_0194064284 /NCGR_PEP_ID=MMETSP0009_2-20130614/82585_1 /TAXON_ID=210454 /ORGANISM="Grammatophora oceanica, Strain CCMP 410" /LENGTH=230 /DNA_ID=CAMNT_0038716705 /DNA_START=126 /DNA_END=818 /DNA_ORIENTATION=+
MTSMRRNKSKGRRWEPDEGGDDMHHQDFESDPYTNSWNGPFERNTRPAGAAMQSYSKLDEERLGVSLSKEKLIKILWESPSKQCTVPGSSPATKRYSTMSRDTATTDNSSGAFSIASSSGAQSQHEALDESSSGFETRHRLRSNHQIHHQEPQQQQREQPRSAAKGRMAVHWGTVIKRPSLGATQLDEDICDPWGNGDGYRGDESVKSSAKDDDKAVEDAMESSNRSFVA